MCCCVTIAVEKVLLLAWLLLHCLGTLVLGGEVLRVQKTPPAPPGAQILLPTENKWAVPSLGCAIVRDLCTKNC